MKKLMVFVALIAGIIALGACGSKPDKDTQKVIDKLVKYEEDVNNSEFDGKSNKYKYKEDDFSFCIYYDSNQKLYLIDSWVPYHKEANNTHLRFSTSLNDPNFEKIEYGSDWNDAKKAGDFKVVYKSGKFND